MTKALLFAGLLLVSSAGCSKSSSSSTTSPSNTPATPTITETFAGTLPVGGSRFYSFSISVYGTVNATLVGIDGPDVPGDVTVNLGIGLPSGTTCAATVSTSVSTGGTVLVTAAEQPGIYCVVISDVGNLPAAASFAVAIGHP